MGLPVIVERNIWTLPQERYNADWVLERNAGMVVPNFRGIRGTAEELLRDLPRYQAAVKRIHNRAVFEIPDMLEKILSSPARS
jgi:1,2-diacylglycerol 3-beta-galactosyltransferase